ncbi:MAG: YkgJ family cysteine cluster protein [Spirochaetes bacterium]|nr:YkgJ family cysteine cluster protein [Spirochaetota bacterium]
MLFSRSESPETNKFKCRPGCGACCIAISISSPIPGMKEGKPAGIRCVNLDINNMCLLFGKKERPKVCVSLRPTKEMCGDSFPEAVKYLEKIEKETTP